MPCRKRNRLAPFRTSCALSRGCFGWRIRCCRQSRCIWKHDERWRRCAARANGNADAIDDCCLAFPENGQLAGADTDFASLIQAIVLPRRERRPVQMQQHSPQSSSIPTVRMAYASRHNGVMAVGMATDRQFSAVLSSENATQTRTFFCPGIAMARKRSGGRHVYVSQEKASTHSHHEGQSSCDVASRPQASGRSAIREVSKRCFRGLGGKPSGADHC